MPDRINFTCSNCNQKIAAPEHYAGKRVRCPKCKAPTRVPEPVARTDSRQPDIIKFRCPNCNQKIGIGRDYAGKRVRCAKCKNSLLVPQAPGESERAVKDQTEVLRAGREQLTKDQPIPGDMAAMDELLLAKPTVPSVEGQVEQGPVDGPVVSEVSAQRSQLSQPGSLGESAAGQAQPGKRRSAIFIGAGCALGFLLVGIVVWYFLADSDTGKSEMDVELHRAQRFAEQYITLLEDGETDRARELLSPGLQSDVQKDDIERLARQIGKSKILELDCELTHFEENPEGNQFFLMYNLRYEEAGQSVIISVLEIDEELKVDAIAAQEPFGDTVLIGPSSYEDLLVIVLAGAFEKYGPIFAKFFCGFVIVALVLGLVQVVSMWVVFDRAGQPGWAVIVPIYNTWVLAEVGDKPGWLGLLMFFGGAIPFVGPIVQLVLLIVISIGVAKAFGRGVVFGIGLSLVPFVFYPILAFAGD